MHLASELFLLRVLGAATFLASNALQLRPAGASCMPHERHALLAFRHGISRDPMGLLASWQKDDQGDCCRWRGVRCSNKTGHVLKLQLRNLHVTWASFQYEDQLRNTALVGQISHSLLSLDNLVHLDLSMNLLNGSSGLIPEFLSSLVNLRYLNLSGIPFSGRVPPQLGNLSKLQYLDISKGQGMYSTDISWLQGLPMLEYLSMSMVNLSTVANWPAVVNMIPSLKFLSLGSCSLASANQSLQHVNLTRLERLDLTANHFDHPMASGWFWNLTGLQYLNLVGTNLYGEVPDALEDMTSLQVLDLSSNLNMGMMMTRSLKKLCNLTVLDLSACDLSADIKELIDLLPQCPLNKLQELHLGDNRITGIMPSQMAHLTSLVVLDISENHLSGAIPPEVGHLPRLSTLQLSGNNLSGHLPSEIGMLPSLSVLDLYGNNLSGHVPSEIGMLSNLTVLDLSYSKLEGNITEIHLAKLAKLTVLHLYGNSLKISVSSEWLPPFSLQAASLANCQIGPQFPAWFRFQVNVESVDISNTGIIDKLPDWFSTTFSKATYLDISHNQINGTLPKNMELMSLETFYLSSNELTGQIPSLPRNLSMLDFSLNSLSGNLPSNFGTPHLEYVNLFSNHITGVLPVSICELQSSLVLDLGANQFEGELPQCFTITTLVFLLLSNNSFSGDFPLSLQNCKELEVLDLSRNKFSGTLPHWIGGLVQLRALRLSQNMFSGNIPTSITNLAHLRHLNLASNWLSGVIPRGLSNLTAMTEKYAKAEFPIDEIMRGHYMQMSHITGDFFSAVTKGQELNYGVFLEMVSIDLSFNQLSGGVPEEIASLDALINFNLSWNHFNGEIPYKIGLMELLESLDLSNNLLSGEIPTSLSNLSYLSYLDLSNNNLTGRIPSGRQLDTIYTEYPSMYSGNSDLCGPPLLNICSGNNVSRQDVKNRDEHGFDPMSFYFGLGLGFMLGLWVVLCVLLFQKTWRTAYFCLFDRIYDQMYVFVGVKWKSLVRERSTD